MLDAGIVTTVRTYLRALRENGLDVVFGVVFGSQATGNAHALSDIDLVVVASEFDRGRDRKEVGRLWRIAARIDSRVEPIPCGEKQWREDDGSAIIEIARREGELVSLGDR